MAGGHETPGALAEGAGCTQDDLLGRGLDRIDQAQGPGQTGDALLAVARLFGMDRVAAMPVREGHAGAIPLLFTNWPQDWIDRHAEGGGVERDPARRWALMSGVAIGWAELQRRVPSSGQEACFYRRAAEAGWAAWFFVPARTSGGRLGVVTIGGRRAPLRPAERGALLLAAQTAYERADALAGSPATSLSPREAHCVAQLADGAQFSEIATALGVSVTTIRFHLDNARRKTGARSCTHLVALAIGAQATGGTA